MEEAIGGQDSRLISKPLKQTLNDARCGAFSGCNTPADPQYKGCVNLRLIQKAAADSKTVISGLDAKLNPSGQRNIDFVDFLVG